MSRVDVEVTVDLEDRDTRTRVGMTDGRTMFVNISDGPVVVRLRFDSPEYAAEWLRDTADRVAPMMEPAR